MAGLEIRALTGLRGIAAILFVVFHEAGNFAGTGPAATFLRHGYNAVDLFFVLSGFVMALTYRAKFRGGARIVRFNPVRSGAERLLHPIHAPMAPQLAIGISTLAVVACAA